MMKIIHTADLHLCSQITASLDPEKSAIRRAEILYSFRLLVEYARENDVSAILISGDMFDEKERIVRSTLKTVTKIFEENPKITFFILSGNHDGEDFSKFWDGSLSNVKLFPKDAGFTTYELDKGISVSGAVLSTDDNVALTESLRLDKGSINLVMLHGQMERSGNVLCRKMLADKGIDYLALGHIHSYRAERLDKRGIYCYSGCLAGRGFDECGQKGFSLITIEGGKLSHEFVPLAGRIIHSIDVDASGSDSLTSLIMEKCADVSENDIVSINLVGEYEEDAAPDTEYLRTFLADKFWYARVVNKMSVHTDLSRYRNTVCIKGEFLRLVEGSRLSEEEKKRVISCGLAALLGEDRIF